MNRRWILWLCCGIAAFFAAVAVHAVDPPPAPPAPPAACDLLLLADGGPLRLRLNVEVEGKPLAVREDEYYRRLFACYHCDCDEDGVFELPAAELALRGDPLRRLLASGKPFHTAGLDADGDGKVTPSEFTNFCRREDRFLQVETLAFADPYADTLTRALFTALDRDKDGKLSRAEVKAAAETLAALDQDDDECIVPLELAPGLFTAGAKTTPVADEAVVVLRAGDEASARSKLLEHYGKEMEAKLDAWLKAAPDFEAVVRLGDADVVAIKASAGARPEFADAVRRRGPGRLVLSIGGRLFDIGIRTASDAFDPPPAWTPEALRQAFRKADDDRKGSLQAAALSDDSYKPLRTLLTLAHHEGDGALTDKALDDYLNLQKLARDGVVTLTTANQPRGWFELLDADHDGRLSVRELRNAWERLADADAEKTGFLTPPSQASISITLSRGRTLDRGQAMYMPANPLASTRGPLWFRKMDRNGDGDLSRREFIGTPEEFRKLDRDGDGLISVE